MLKVGRMSTNTAATDTCRMSTQSKLQHGWERNSRSPTSNGYWQLIVTEEGWIILRVWLLIGFPCSTGWSNWMDLEGYQKKKKEDMKLGGRLVGIIWGEWRGKIEVDMITVHWTHI